MKKDLLPIGTVVVLKESEGRVMISGYLPVTDSDGTYVWDYSGFRFPIGYVNDKEVYCFDHEQIDAVIQYGFKDYECIDLLDKIEEAMDEIKEKVAGGQENV
ncbi:MAG: DUF4176 domain-containing protein [Butyrivibrio sp.]|nr:DUF4176 domain-containing protein [Butyrivibrio sp.]